MSKNFKDREINVEPAMNIGDGPYFAAAALGRLLVKKCQDCGRHHHYPRGICPFCFSSAVQWTDAAGKGTIYSYTVVRRGVPEPFCLAYVELDEGPRMLTNIVDCDLDAVRIGQPVQVAFKKTVEGTSLPMFTPTDA